MVLFEKLDSLVSQDSEQCTGIGTGQELVCFSYHLKPACLELWVQRGCWMSHQAVGGLCVLLPFLHRVPQIFVALLLEGAEHHCSIERTVCSQRSSWSISCLGKGTFSKSVSFHWHTPVVIIDIQVTTTDSGSWGSFPVYQHSLTPLLTSSHSGQCCLICVLPSVVIILKDGGWEILF